MLNIIKKQHQELIIGLADLYTQKEQIEAQIKTQRVAIEQCNVFIRQGEENAQA